MKLEEQIYDTTHKQEVDAKHTLLDNSTFFKHGTFINTIMYLHSVEFIFFFMVVS